MGLISLPIMLRYGYDRKIASGVIAASGTLAQIIPPSLVLIVLADQLGRSVGDMYRGALVPGLVLTGLYALFVIAVALVARHKVPGLPPEAITLREPDGSRGFPSLIALVMIGGVFGWAMTRDPMLDASDRVVFAMAYGIALAAVLATLNWLLFRLTKRRLLSTTAEHTTFVMLPPLALIFLVLGTIFIGVATPTEGGAMGAAGALVLALIKRRLSFDLLRQAVEATARLSTFVVFILIGARVFSLTFFGVDGHRWVEHLLTALPGGQIGFLVFVNLFVFFLAFFLDFFEIAFIIIPLLKPVADKLGIDLIWFGVILGVNMQTSFLHPPFGFALFYLRSVAPRRPYLDRVTGREIAGVSTAQIYWGAVPFLFIQVLMIALVTLMPSMVMRYKQRPMSPPSGPTEIAPPGLPPPPSFDAPPPGLQLPPPPTLNLPPPTLDPGK
jgi:TRAP-type mannitol/chloroaromatic compound transport system permease large subunit